MAHKPFTLRFLTAISILLLTMTSCEKSDDYDEENSKDNTEQTGGSPNGGSGSYNDNDGDGYYDDDDNSDGGETVSKSDTLTVAQFIAGGENLNAFVVGYVVGDCTKSFKYAEFEPPFTHPQALLIADTKDERDKDYIVAVQLKSGTKARMHMNLVDNPGWYGKKIVLFGYRCKYLGMAGMKDLGAYPLYNP